MSKCLFAFIKEEENFHEKLFAKKFPKWKSNSQKLDYHVCDAIFKLFEKLLFSTPNRQNSGKVMEEKSPTKV
jgi:hypothetical protein